MLVQRFTTTDGEILTARDADLDLRKAEFNRLSTRAPISRIEEHDEEAKALSKRMFSSRVKSTEAERLQAERPQAEKPLSAGHARLIAEHEADKKFLEDLEGLVQQAKVGNTQPLEDAIRPRVGWKIISLGHDIASPTLRKNHEFGYIINNEYNRLANPTSLELGELLLKFRNWKSTAY